MNIIINVQNKIPSLLYGGTERVVWYLGKELIKLGHNVTFIAPEGSSCDFAKVIIKNNSLDLNSQIPIDTDLVHIFDDCFFENLDFPHVVTIEGNPKFSVNLNINSIFVSENHANRYNSNSFVYNGLDWESYDKPNLNSKREYFHFLGKAAWDVKNVKGAINTIINSKTEKLRILGGHRFHPNTFTLSRKIKFEGMVNDAQKSVLINKSKGLLFPVLWNEPFGLAIIESMYFGCPVFGTPYGSLSELVPKNVGFLSNDSSEIEEALKNAESYNKKECNEYAIEYFNSKLMAETYLKKYYIVLEGEKLNKIPPTLLNKSNGLLDWK